MDTSRKICTILTPTDLSEGNIKTTVKTIEHNADKFYLLQTGWQINLWEVVEQLGKVSEDENTLTKMRIAYDLKFNLRTVLKTGGDLSADGTEVKRLADLLETMEFDDNLNLNRADYHVIINDDGIEPKEGTDEASRAVAKLFQQTVFLNIVGLDIQKKSEIKKALIKTRFRENYSKLRDEILDNKKFIESKLSDGTRLSSESRERASKIIAAFDAMLAGFDKAKARPIRIAAMGTKKAGKSVVINSLLKRDYAPTSSTLPTPNTIKYIPADPKKPLTLEYGGKTYTFADDKAISDFIGTEFKKAQKITGEGAGLPDMTIYYPSDELNGYEVWDTPGPNVAFTDEHQKNAEACIREVDVCIFVMNYSNHLTNDEVTFLKNIHSFFKDNNKFYSLFITVNRIDERYAVNEEKSVDRILDYIGSRLEALTPPYKNIVIFGTSALQSFYLDNVINLVKADRADDGEDIDALPLIDADSIRPLKRAHKDSLTPIKFIGDALGNLEDFHGIENATEKELYALSGVPQLWAYTQYIGGSKADVEIVNNVVGNCELSFKNVNNSLIVTDLLNLSDKDKKYLEELAVLIADLKRYVDSAIDEIRPLANPNNTYAAFHEVTELMRTLKREAQNNVTALTHRKINTAVIPTDDVRQNRHGYKPQSVKNIETAVNNEILRSVNQKIAVELDKVKQRVGESQSQKVNSAIQGAQSKIAKKTDEVKSKVKNATAKNIMQSFNPPEFPSSVNNLMTVANKVNIALDDSIFSRAANNAHSTKLETRHRTVQETRVRNVTREREASGIWENIRSFFGKTYYEIIPEEYTVDVDQPYQVSVDVYDVQGYKDNIESQMQSRITKALENAHEKMEEAIKQEIRNIFADIDKQCDEIGGSYKQLFSDFERDINIAKDSTGAHRAALLRDIGTFNEIKVNLQPFFKTWDEILHDVKE